MSDYISKQDVIDLINGLDSLPWEEETEEIVNGLPTISESEIIRKAMERIASRIQQVIWDSCSSDEYKYASEEIEKIFNEVCVEEGDINE